MKVVGHMGAVFYYIAFNYFFNSLFYIWRIKNAKHLTLGIILFLYIFHSISYGLFFTGDILNVPALYGIFPMLNSFLIVSYYFYLSFLLEPSFYWKKYHLLLFLFPLIQLGFYIRHVTLGTTIHLEIVQNALKGNHSIYYPDQISFFLHVFCLISIYIFSATLFLNKFKWSKVRGPKTSKVKMTIAIVIVWESTVAFLDTQYVFNYYFGISQSPWNPLVNYASAFLFLVFLQFWPYYYVQGPVYFNSKTFGLEGFFRSYLDGVDLDKLDSSFNTLMYEQKIYIADDISLPKIAEKLDISVHQLSEYFNRHLNTRFNDFIGQMRVNESKRLLEESPEKSIVEVCYEVGFNSSSAFYKTFKKITGATPKSWRTQV